MTGTQAECACRVEKGRNSIRVILTGSGYPPESSLEVVARLEGGNPPGDPVSRMEHRLTVMSRADGAFHHEVEFSFTPRSGISATVSVGGVPCNCG